MAKEALLQMELPLGNEPGLRPTRRVDACCVERQGQSWQTEVTVLRLA